MRNTEWRREITRRYLVLEVKMVMVVVAKVKGQNRK